MTRETDSDLKANALRFAKFTHSIFKMTIPKRKKGIAVDPQPIQRIALFVCWSTRERTPSRYMQQRDILDLLLFLGLARVTPPEGRKQAESRPKGQKLEAVLSLKLKGVCFSFCTWHLHISSKYLTILVDIGKINEIGQEGGLGGEKECYGHPVQCQLPS